MGVLEDVMANVKFKHVQYTSRNNVVVQYTSRNNLVCPTLSNKLMKTNGTPRLAILTLFTNCHISSLEGCGCVDYTSHFQWTRILCVKYLAMRVWTSAYSLVIIYACMFIMHILCLLCVKCKVHSAAFQILYVDQLNLSDTSVFLLCILIFLIFPESSTSTLLWIDLCSAMFLCT